MRLAVISDAVLPTPFEGGHGLGRMVHQIATGLLQRGHDVTLFARKDSRFDGKLVMPEDANGYPGEVALAREVLRQHRQWAFDAILDNSHIHKLSDLFPDLPVVNVFHDNFQSYARCAVVMSFGQKALLPPEFADARVIHNALNPADFQATTQPANPPFIFWCGAISPIKQPLLAIEACARTGVKLVMAGAEIDGRLPQSAFSNVEYVGVVNAQQRNRLMQAARVFLQLGTVESFGLTTLEANLNGCPVVAWPAGGSLDLIHYGYNGVFVPMQGANKVQNVVDAIERAWDIDRSNVRAVSETTSVDAQITNYETVLIDVVRGNWW